MHDDWVLHIRCCPLLYEYGFVSCSKGSGVSAYYGDIHGAAPAVSTGIKRGVTCVDYSELLSSIYAGCVDGKVSVYSIYALRDSKCSTTS